MFSSKVTRLGEKICIFAGYMATLVACGWERAMIEKVTLAFRSRSSELTKLKNAKKVKVAKALDGQRYLCPALVSCA